MDEKRCYLAVDGGNSKTEYRLLDASGMVFAARRGGASNHEMLPGGVEDAASLIVSETEELLDAQGYALGQIADAVLGLAGADYAEEAAALRDKVQARLGPEPDRTGRRSTWPRTSAAPAGSSSPTTS